MLSLVKAFLTQIVIMNNFIKHFLLAALITSPFITYADEDINLANNNPYPLYVGVLLGYASTNWSALVDEYHNQAVDNTTPVAADDSGPDKGLFIGYNLIKNFAVEFRYQNFSDTAVAFDRDQNTNYVNGKFISSFISSTYAYSLVAKVMLPLGSSPFSIFSDFGGVYTHRDDIFANAAQEGDPYNGGYPAGTNHNYGVMFGAGVNYEFTSHLFNTIEFSYGSGNGSAIQFPTFSYIPFIYSIDYKIAYRFAV